MTEDPVIKHIFEKDNGLKVNQLEAVKKNRVMKAPRSFANPDMLLFCTRREKLDYEDKNRLK